MSGTNNLGIDQIEENSASPEVPINDAYGRFDSALTESKTADLTAGNVTISVDDGQTHQRILATNATVAGRTLTLPLLKRLLIVTSDSTSTKSISIVRGSTSFVLASGNSVLCYTDGTANGLVVTAAGDLNGAPYDLGIFIPGVTSNNQIMLRYVFDRTVTFAANLAGSKYSNGTNPTATDTVTIKKNGALIGATSTASISTLGVVTFTVSAVTFDAGDVLSLHGQAVADATLADISFTFKGTRT